MILVGPFQPEIIYDSLLKNKCSNDYRHGHLQSWLETWLKRVSQLATDWNILIAKLGTFSQAFFPAFPVNLMDVLFLSFSFLSDKRWELQIPLCQSHITCYVSLLFWNRSSTMFNLAYTRERQTLDMNIQQIFRRVLIGFKFGGCTDHQNLVPYLPWRLLGSAENKTWYKQE